MDDLKYLRIALELAQKAKIKGSVPIGALIVDGSGKIIAKGINRIKIDNDPTAHAEIVCMRTAKKKIIKKISPNPTILYTSLEPCVACGFFTTRTNINKIVWALDDPYRGGIKSLINDLKLSDDMSAMTLISEPDDEMRQQSKKLMHDYYLNKNDFTTSKLFE